jgi:uncharacterized membrane protein (DUF441 family)
MIETAPTLLILLALAGLGIVSHNNTVTAAILILILIRITPLNAAFPMIQKYGVLIGITILTVAVMVPIANGKINAGMLMRSFVEWKSIVAILVGIAVSWLGGRGLVLMGNQPNIVAGLLIGTILGVALFKGVPVGPIIAAGLLSLLIGKG